jgi:hypothetical protein
VFPINIRYRKEEGKKGRKEGREDEQREKGRR